MSESPAPRIREVESVLVWEGEVGNARIREVLGVKPVWASRLLAELARLMGRKASRATSHAPLRLSYGHSASLRERRSPEDYLSLVRSAPPMGPFGVLFEDARVDMSKVSPQVFSTLLDACKRNVGVRVSYRSMTTPSGAERIIFPHVLVRAPRRWHVRAWAADREEYRDFTLGRIIRAELLDVLATHTREKDAGWQRKVDLLVQPHPDLTTDQQAMVAAEYFDGTSAMRLKVRECLANYVAQDLRLATDIKRQRAPEYQLHVSNASELGSSLWG